MMGNKNDENEKILPLGVYSFTSFVALAEDLGRHASQSVQGSSQLSVTPVPGGPDALC